VRLSRPHDKIVPAIVLKDPPHRLDIFAGESPVPAGVKVPIARVIFLVTNVSPRLGDSWLKRMPLLANIPYASR